MKSIFQLNNLRKKIVLSLIIVIVIFALVSAFIINLVIKWEMSFQYRADKEAALESLTYSLKPALEMKDYQQVKQILDSSLIFQNIAFIAVYDNAGALIEAAIQNEVDSNSLAKEIHSLQSTGQTLGSFEIGFSRQYIDNLVSRTTLILILVLVVFLLLAGLALYFFLGYSVIHPLEIFTRTIRKLRPGNLSARIPVSTKDEIGLLAGNFNTMAENLESSYRALQEARDELEHKVELRTRGERRRAEQLRTINEVGRRISAILSLDELLPYVVNSLQNNFKYYNVNLFLIDSDKHQVSLKAGSGGYTGTAPLGYSIPLGQGIVGGVARTGEPLNIGDVGNEPGYIRSPELTNTRSEMAVPVKIRTEILGVLDIQSIEFNAFDEIDLFTIQTLADQLAIALENVRLYQESRDIAVIAERNRLAREIHDTLAQGFTGIILQLEAAEQALVESPEFAHEHLDRARKLARTSLHEARRSVWALRPQELEQLPLADALKRGLAAFTRDTGIQTEFNTPQNAIHIPAEVENALLRIFQEALTNIRKHAAASHVLVGLDIGEQEITFKISDNGTGFDTEIIRQNHFGLISMRERAKLLKGSLEIRSEPGKGTHLELKIPVSGRQL